MTPARPTTRHEDSHKSRQNPNIGYVLLSQPSMRHPGDGDRTSHLKSQKNLIALLDLKLLNP